MKRRPRVLQICHDYRGPFGAIARQYAHAFADCDVRTLFLRGPADRELAAAIHGEVDFLSLGPLRGLKLAPMRRVKSLLADAPDLVIAHRYKPFVIAMMLNYQFDIGAVLGVMHEFGFLGRRSRSLLSRFWRGNVHLIGVSEPLCRHIQARHRHLGARVHVVPLSIETSTPHDAAVARRRLGIPPEVYCYGVIGRLVRKKNHALLLHAFAELDEPCLLALVGEGYLLGRLQALAGELAIADRVIFCGAHDEARACVRAFDALVLPSTEEEAFGLVLLEAMAASVPVLSTDAAGPASVVGDAARLFKCGDAKDLARGLRDMRTLPEAERTRLTGKAQARVRREFSPAVMAQRLRALPPVAMHAPVS